MQPVQLFQVTRSRFAWMWSVACHLPGRTLVATQEQHRRRPPPASATCLPCSSRSRSQVQTPRPAHPRSRHNPKEPPRRPRGQTCTPQNDHP